MLSFSTVFPTQLVGVTVAFMFRGERREAEIESLKYRQDEVTLEIRVRVRTPKGKFYWLSADEPFDVVKGRTS